MLKAYARTADEAHLEFAENLLGKMEDMYMQNPNTNLKPDRISYTTLIAGWSHVKKPIAMKRAEQIQDRMMNMVKNGNDDATPDNVLRLNMLNTVFGRESAKKAEAIVNDMIKDREEHKIAVTKLIKEWTLSRDVHDAGERAEYIIEFLLQQYEKTKNEVFLPDSYLFSAAISAWGSTKSRDAARRAEKLLEKMISLYEETQLPELRPNKFVFTSAIRAWARPNQPNKVQNAKRVFDRMIGMYDGGQLEEGPDQHIFSALFKACAHNEKETFGDSDDLMIAVDVYRTLCTGKYCSPNEATYGSYMSALRSTMHRGEARNAVVKEAFDRCCSEGLCNEFIVWQLKRTVDKKTFDNMVEAANLPMDKPIGLEDLPSYWTRRVSKDKRRRDGPKAILYT